MAHELEFHYILDTDEETSYTLSYCPELDIHCYGKDDDDAKAALAEAIQVWIDRHSEKGTLKKELAKRKIFFPNAVITAHIPDDKQLQYAP